MVTGIVQKWLDRAEQIRSQLSVPLGFNDSRHDALLALMEWVERGNAPSDIIASEFNFTNPERQSITLYRQRPICVYPRKAVWDRTGAQDDASSWSCR